MAEFSRIAEARNPQRILGTPMEAGLIPNVGDYFLEEFDRIHGHRADEYRHQSDPISNTWEIEEELFARYLKGMEICFSSSRSQGIDIDAIPILVDNRDKLREIVGRTLAGRLCGLQLSTAIEKAWPKETDKRRERIALLELLLAYGYRPPRSAAALLARGTQGLPKGQQLKHLLPLAKRVASDVFTGRVTSELQTYFEERYRDRDRHKERVRLLADAMKNRVEAPWPEGFFDKTVRLHLFFAAAGRAYRRAFDQFFIFSDVEIVQCGEQWFAIAHDEWRKFQRSRNVSAEQS